ncbi:hypothetical protein LSUE1_G009866, partial [Lachnellula suecica]
MYALSEAPVEESNLASTPDLCSIGHQKSGENCGVEYHPKSVCLSPPDSVPNTASQPESMGANILPGDTPSQAISISSEYSQPKLEKSIEEPDSQEDSDMDLVSRILRANREHENLGTFDQIATHFHDDSAPCTCDNGLLSPPKSPKAPSSAKPAANPAPKLPELQTSPPEAAPKRLPRNTLSLQERKRIFVGGRSGKLMDDMKKWWHKTEWLLDPFREDDDCWLHPNPPPARRGASGQQLPCGTISKVFQWQDQKGRHTLVVNYGIVCKLLYYDMTKQQKDGFINRSFHVSHLCGNWTCINPVHTVIEPGEVNISRNNCFSHRSGCLHNPPCLKDKKVPLGSDGRLVDQDAPVYAPVVLGEHWDEWGLQNIGDDDDYPTVDVLEEPVALPRDEDAVVHGFDAHSPPFPDAGTVANDPKNARVLSPGAETTADDVKEHKLLPRVAEVLA